MICPNCGAEIKVGTRFCTKCGVSQCLEENINEQTIVQQQQEEPINELKNPIKKQKNINKKSWIICIITTIILIVVFGGFISTKFIKAKETSDNINLGNKYLQEGRYEEAILAFEKTLKIDSKNIPARLGIGKSYLLMDKVDEAKKVFNDAIDINTKNVDVYISISEIYIEMNMNDEAILILKEGYKNTGDENIKNKIDDIEQNFSIDNIDITVNQNANYDLPLKVKININNSDEELEVEWQEATVDTTKIGTYTFNGITKEYDRKIILTLNVISGIAQVDDINISIVQGQQYSLPEKVKAKMNDNSRKDFSVVWNPSNMDINSVGTHIFDGSIDGYDKAFKLILTISPTEQEMQMNKDTKNKLDTFFSNFSETYVEPFEESNISNEALIHFGVLHIIINYYMKNNNLVEKRTTNPYNGYIKDTDVDNMVYRYFGKRITTHKSISEYTYENGYYKFPFASGEAYTFSQINSLYNLGNDFYKAEVSIYVASNGFAGDPHGTIDDWKNNEVPELKKNMVAKIKKVSEDGKERYILISYKNK